MKLFTVVFLATGAFALPQGSGRKSPGLMSMEEGMQKCGEHAKLACCNGGGSLNENKGDQDEGSERGRGGNRRDGTSMFDQCSEVESDSLLGLGGLLGDKCKQNIACCDSSDADTDGGLINISLPCISLQDLL